MIFVTFGGGSENYRNATKRLCEEIKQINLFTKIKPWTDIELKKDIIFWNRHKHFIENNNRGYGYWLWKSYIINNELKSINKGDILVYADAGCTININNIDIFRDQIETLKNNDKDNIAFVLNQTEKKWQKNDTAIYLEATQQMMDSNQLCATYFILKKTTNTINMVDKWYNTCSIYKLLDDTLSVSKNCEIFVEHRHDQSIWSLIRKKNNNYIEIYYKNTLFNDARKRC